MPYKSREDKKANARKYRQANVEKHRQWSRSWRLNNPERDKELRKRERENLSNDPERYERRRRADAEFRRRQRIAALNMYGDHACNCCGEATFEFLSFDHINGLGGAKRLTGVSLLAWLLEERREDIQVLCHNCNMAKGFYGRCPHRDR
jgi:hypothetical protein